jgi:hypothetical protein
MRLGTIPNERDLSRAKDAEFSFESLDTDPVWLKGTTEAIDVLAVDPLRKLRRSHVRNERADSSLNLSTITSRIWAAMPGCDWSVTAILSCV